MSLFTSYILRIVYERDNERPTPRVMVQAIGTEEWLTFGDLADLAAYLDAEARRQHVSLREDTPGGVIARRALPPKQSPGGG